MSQVIKFVVTGVLNTGLDLGILYLLMTFTGVSDGALMIPFNAFSFSIATVNSFFLNKYWTFKKEKKRKKREKEITDFSQFLLVSIIGMAINSSIVFLFTTYVPAFFGLESIKELLEALSQKGFKELWALTAKIFATAVSLVWNFLGYKFWVFKK